MEKSDFENMDWENIETEEKTGFILEVDLEYPKKSTHKHSNFPLAPENKTVTFNDLSPYCKETFCSIEKREKYSDRKLIATYNNRSNYIVPFKNLKLYLQLGMKLKCVH